MRQRHSIDILFSLSLFTVFVICAFLVLLFQAGSYQAIIKQGEEVERMHTPLAYLRAKIRSADEDGAVSVRQLEDTDAIVIHDKKERTVTYISVSYTHLDVYKRQQYDIMSAWDSSNRKRIRRPITDTLPRSS